MKPFAFVVTALPLLFFSCKENEKPSPSLPDDYAIITYYNLSEDKDLSFYCGGKGYTVLKPGEKSKPQKVDSGEMVILVAQKLPVDTQYVSGFISKRNDEYTLFATGSGTMGFHVDRCYTPPQGKAYIRYLGINSYNKIIITANTTDTLLNYSTRGGFFCDTIPQPCNAINAGKHTISLYNTLTPGAVVYSKSNVNIEKDMVYYVYLNAKNEVKIIER